MMLQHQKSETMHRTRATPHRTSTSPLRERCNVSHTHLQLSCTRWLLQRPLHLTFLSADRPSFPFN